MRKACYKLMRTLRRWVTACPFAGRYTVLKFINHSLKREWNAKDTSRFVGFGFFILTHAVQAANGFILARNCTSLIVFTVGVAYGAINVVVTIVQCDTFAHAVRIKNGWKTSHKIIQRNSRFSDTNCVLITLLGQVVFLLCVVTGYSNVRH